MARARAAALIVVVFGMLGAGRAEAGTLSPSTFRVRIGSLPPLTVSSNSEAPGGTDYQLVELFPQVFGPVDLDVPDILFTGVPLLSDVRISGLTAPRSHVLLRPGGGIAYSGNVSAPGGGRGGRAPLSGSLTVCIFGCDLIQVSVPLTVVGAGGQVVDTLAGRTTLVLTAGQGWTTGTARIHGVNTEVVSYAGVTCAPVTCGYTTLALGTGIGVYRTSVSLAGYDSLVPRSRVHLVTPARISSFLLQEEPTPIFFEQILYFSEGPYVVTPEPGAAALLALGLALAGVRRRRRRRRP